MSSVEFTVITSAMQEVLQFVMLVRMCVCDVAGPAGVYSYRGQLSVAMVLGGVDSTGNHLYSIFPHGSTSRLPFTSMGITRHFFLLHLRAHRSVAASIMFAVCSPVLQNIK